MTYQEEQSLKAQVADLLRWKAEREQQQIRFPIDDASRKTIGGGTSEGPGSSGLTQSISLTGGAESILVPSAYIGTELFVFEGIRYEIPYISTS